ncbi:MAG: DAK2 domain-containing protein [Clostridia bacterium]|nr:DAK2 domain-containing protein [Clostridia bacterium]
MKTDLIDGALFADMVKGGAANLGANRQLVNDLNVFPIPDGDTGDNMYMTINSGAAELEHGKASTLAENVALVARGMLLGARGNSGVILSRIFAGVSQGLQGVERADVADIHRALRMGVDEAYRAVSVPVEGTILTVYRDAVDFASSRLDENSTLESYFSDFIDEVKRSLDRTPELLDVLRQAGVVDSGGAGFLYIMEGMIRAFLGEGESAFSAGAEGKDAPKRADISLFTEDSELKFGYCTEFLLRLQRSKCDIDAFDLEGFIDWLNSEGDSVVAFRDGSIVKVHVHTFRPGDVLNHCQQFGEFLTLKIENMTLQHSETKIENRYSPVQQKPHKPYGIVTVAAGGGIKDTFVSLGCDEVVDGGQSMNPSAEDFIRAFERINADVILVFPNNGNVILTANQAAALYEGAEVRVIPSKTVGEGYAAVSMLDTSSGDTDAIVSEMEEVIAGVVTGLVSCASRDTEKDGVTVKAGDFIGFEGDTIYVDSDVRNEAALGLAEKLGAGDYDIILIICGGDVPSDEVHALTDKLRESYRRTEVITIDGGQPIYDYIMIFE